MNYEEALKILEDSYNDFQDMKMFIQMMLHHLRPGGDFISFDWEDVWRLREIADRLDGINKETEE